MASIGHPILVARCRWTREVGDELESTIRENVQGLHCQLIELCSGECVEAYLRVN